MGLSQKTHGILLFMPTTPKYHAWRLGVDLCGNKGTILILLKLYNIWNTPLVKAVEYAFIADRFVYWWLGYILLANEKSAFSGMTKSVTPTIAFLTRAALLAKVSIIEAILILVMGTSGEGGWIIENTTY